MADPHNLQRFVDAQDEVDPLEQRSIYDVAISELLQGRKTSHWMWFVFPQLKGLGTSSRSTYFGIGSRDEALDYLAHQVLGPRLRTCARLVKSTQTTTATALMGEVDAMKLHASMTLFAVIDRESADFGAVLDRFYGGELDARTLRLLETV